MAGRLQRYVGVPDILSHSFSYWDYVNGRLEPCNERGVRACQRINLLHDRNARRKREAFEECHQQTTIRVSDAGGDCLDGRPADR